MPYPTMTSSPSAPFPTYLTPSLPFRRRTSSTDSTSSASVSPTERSQDTSYGFDGVEPDLEDGYLSGHRSHLRCSRCLSDLALSSQIISKGFTGRHGRAYLVAATQSAISSNPASMRSAKARNDALPNLPNTYTHKPVPRQLVTGAHTVGDISCAQCGSVLGWKYLAAEEESQHYKIGKFILETRRVCRAPTWETEDGVADAHPTSFVAGAGRRPSTGPAPPNHISQSLANSHDDVEFDSQDEDECEDLFMGVWTPQLAQRRRKTKSATAAVR